jgi:two-component system sensor histidine kinase/response regulator
VLKEYQNENRDTLSMLEAAVRDKRYNDAVQILHKLKSSSGSIGAAPVRDAAMELQKTLNEEKEEEIMPLLDKFSGFMRKLLAELNDRVPE